MRSLGMAREKVDIRNLFYDQLFPCSAMNRIQLVDSSLRSVYLLQRPISLAIEKEPQNSSSRPLYHVNTKTPGQEPLNLSISGRLLRL